jgi:very-short-patch-repair endonuclease
LKKDKRYETGSYIWSFHQETRSERRLADAMRKAGLKFGQEVPVQNFTVDFLVDQWLVVEVDGESHLVKGRAEKDASRQKAIEDAGFTVMRVPAGDLSSEGGLKRWVKRIKDRVGQGPPYLNQGGSANLDYLRQIEEVKKALRIGEAERKRREAHAFDSRGLGRGREQRTAEPEESMEDYFGKEAEDFGSLLKDYDWRKQAEATRDKDEESLSGARKRFTGRKRGRR